MVKLRDYQIEAVDLLRAGIRAGHRRQILCSPTGSGKTVIGAHLLSAAREKGKRGVFVIDRLSLKDQTSAFFDSVGLPHGVIQGKTKQAPLEPVQVVTAQTAARRGFWPPADLVVVDECHISHGATTEWCESIEVPVIGLSASPLGKLAEHWDSVINVRSTYDLIADGWCTPLRVFSPTKIDTEHVKINSSGEWRSSELSGKVLEIVGDILSNWVTTTDKVFSGRRPKTIVFSASVDDGRRIASEFSKAGYPFEQISYQDRDDESRSEKIAAHRAGEILGLVSCEALQRGYDVPDIECVIDAHPYRKSLSAVIQQIGRGMRPAPGKEFCLLMDHARNYARFETRLRDFWAEGVTDLESGAVSAPGFADEFHRPGCPSCGYMPDDPGWRVCPSCGFVMPRPKGGGGREIRIVDGKFRELYSDGTWGEPPPPKPPVEQLGKNTVWEMLRRLAPEYGKHGDAARRWCQANYREIFGDFARRNFWNTKPFDGKVDPVLIEHVEKKRRAFLASRKRKAA